MADPWFPAKNRASPESRGGESAPAPILSRRIFGQLVFFTLLLLSIGVGALGGMIFVYSADVPQVRQLEDYRQDVMTERYADDGAVIGCFELERRVLGRVSQQPKVLEV